jgi:hypothetical protein
MSETEPRFWDGLGPRLIVTAATLLLVLVILIFVLLRWGEMVPEQDNADAVAPSQAAGHR